ncbi:hypothetical protein HU200_031983 [Digitaria exilis]|uniref:F-box domain-containing protein n=1 Tax=Digitaria exilis TaxID=1010633 RepID=A0A835BN59_9POAL|nr:hypothetical protein HU200_031983 [Digitaria exilis]
MLSRVMGWAVSEARSPLPIKQPSGPLCVPPPRLDRTCVLIELMVHLIWPPVNRAVRDCARVETARLQRLDLTPRRVPVDEGTRMALATLRGGLGLHLQPHVSGEAHRPPDPTYTASNVAGIDTLRGDVLVDVLRRLRAHSLARCRCVCALWRALVDGRGLLLLHALPPRAFPGFFANARRVTKPWRRPAAGHGFLPPPSSRAPARDRLAFLRPHLPRNAAAVQHHCNGLVLCFAHDCLASGGTPGAGFVCNPATQRWARLPPPPTWWPRGHDSLFLAFDPAVSLDYEVLLLPVPPPPRRSNGGDATGLGGEAPSCLRQGRVTLGMFVPESFGEKREPSEEKLLPLLVFSSAARQWTKRLLAPGRCAPARLYDRDTDTWARTWRSAVDSICLSTEDGVLLRYVTVDVSRVKVRSLHESANVGGEQMLEWTLTHDEDLAAQARMLDLLHHAPSNCVPLATEGEANGHGSGKCVWFSDEDGEEAAGNGDDVDDGCSRRWWSWDDASLLDLDVGEDELQLLDDVGDGAPPPFTVLGCHPEREVVFLAAGAFHVVAYHLGGGKKVQYLGRVMSLGDGDRLDGVLAYRPCIVDALPHGSW